MTVSSRRNSKYRFIKSLLSQCFPEYPSRQLQIYVDPIEKHVPWFLHGFGKQSPVAKYKNAHRNGLKNTSINTCKRVLTNALVRRNTCVIGGTALYHSIGTNALNITLPAACLTLYLNPASLASLRTPRRTSIEYFWRLTISYWKKFHTQWTSLKKCFINSSISHLSFGKGRCCIDESLWRHLGNSRLDMFSFEIPVHRRKRQSNFPMNPMMSKCLQTQQFYDAYHTQYNVFIIWLHTRTLISTNASGVGRASFNLTVRTYAINTLPAILEACKNIIGCCCIVTSVITRWCACAVLFARRAL